MQISFTFELTKLTGRCYFQEHLLFILFKIVLLNKLILLFVGAENRGHWYIHILAHVRSPDLFPSGYYCNSNFIATLNFITESASSD